MLKRLIQKKYGPLIFSLLAGLGYFMVILKFIMSFTASSYGWLLGLFFAPAIICGSALVLVQALKRLAEQDNMRMIRLLAIIHVILLAVGIFFTCDSFF